MILEIARSLPRSENGAPCLPLVARLQAGQRVRPLDEQSRGNLQTKCRWRQTLLDPGPGMGFYTIELARWFGHEGCVIAFDGQPA
jgi:hypothetical protein